MTEANRSFVGAVILYNFLKDVAKLHLVELLSGLKDGTESWYEIQQATFVSTYASM